MTASPPSNTPPKEVRLSLSDFPAQPWAKKLVDAFNQFSLETTKALVATSAKYKTLDISTGTTVADSFPIDVPVSFIVTDVRVAMVLSGTPSGAVTVTASMLSGGKLLRVSSITGLAASSKYSIRLALV